MIVNKSSFCTFTVLILLIYSCIAGSREHSLPHINQPLANASISAVLSKDKSTIIGAVTYTLTNHTNAALNSLHFWLYANRFIKPSLGLDEGMLKWVYPKERGKKGYTDINGVYRNGQKADPKLITKNSLVIEGGVSASNVIAELKLSSPILPGKTGTVTLSFRTKMPVRRGRFGTYSGVLTAAGGWFPLLMTDLTGKNTALPPDAITVNAKISLPSNLGAVLHDEVFPVKPTPQEIEVNGIVAESLTLVVMDRMEISERSYDWGKAIHVRQSIDWRQPTWEESGRDRLGLPESLPEPGKFNYSTRLLDIVGSTAEAIKEIAPKAELSKKVVLVDIPAWDRMVQPGFGPVLVSDRLWRMIPIKDGLFFHDLSLVRAVAPTMVFESALRNTSSLYRFAAADVLGVFFADYYSKTIHKRMRSVEDIIGFARVLPTIDNLLYAPQVPFREVYFRFYEEPEPLRDEPWLFMNNHPRGKRLLTKLYDRSNEDRVIEAVRNMLEFGLPFDKAVEFVTEEDADVFFNTWYKTYPKLNYRLGVVEDETLSNGKFLHKAEIFRDGEQVKEKVTVRFTDKRKDYIDLIWDSAEAKTELNWESDAPIKRVEIDPDGKLVESGDLTSDHPRRDNLTPLPWRPPMLTSFVIWGDLTEGEPYADIGFLLRRKYDNTNLFSLDLEYTPYAAGGMFSYYRYFGKKRTLNSRTWYIGPVTAAYRYGEVDTPALHLSSDIRTSAVMGSAGIIFGRDTRVYGWDPMKGSSISAAAIYAAGASKEGDFRQAGRISIRLGRLFSLAIHHTIAVYGGASLVLGNPVAANLSSLSDRAKLRGFDSDETFGRIGVYAAAEYRHTLFDAANTTAPLYSWFDRFQGALFVAAGTMSKPSGPFDGIFTKERIFTEVGYGLRLHLLFLGVHQYLLCFDLAVPLTPQNRYLEIIRQDGSIEQTPRSPYKILFGIIQTF